MHLLVNQALRPSFLHGRLGGNSRMAVAPLSLTTGMGCHEGIAKKNSLSRTSAFLHSRLERSHKSPQPLLRAHFSAHSQRTFIGKRSKSLYFLGHRLSLRPANRLSAHKDASRPLRVSLERLRDKLTEHFSSRVQFDEQGQLRNHARIERSLTPWLSWAKGAGIALPQTPLFGRGHSQTAPENKQRGLIWDDITFYPMDSPAGKSPEEN